MVYYALLTSKSTNLKENCYYFRMKDEQVLEKSERIEITETEQVYRLKVKSAVMTDSGSYSVKIANRLGQESRDAKVNVKCPFLYFFYKMGRCSNLVFVTHFSPG